MTASISVKGVSDLLGTIPTLLGYVPTDSVVLLGVFGGRVVVTARTDAGPLTHESMGQLGHVTAAIRRCEVDSVLLVGYHTGAASNAIPLINAVRSAFTAFGVKVEPPVYVTGDQLSGEAVYSCMCSNPACARTGTVPLPIAIPGFAVADSRNDLAARVEAGPRAESVGKALAALTERLSPAEAQAAVLAILESPSARLTDPELALAAHALRDPHYQAMATIGLPLNSGESGADDFGGAVKRITEDATRIERLTELVACLPDHQAVQCLEVLAANAYWRGDGALANIALARAKRHGLSEFGCLVDSALEAGIPPHSFR